MGDPLPPYLKELVVHQYRNVEPGTKLSFGPGVNVLLGRNGTGKTTLLELIAAIRSGEVGRLEAPFHFEYVVEGPTQVAGAFGVETFLRVSAEVRGDPSDARVPPRGDMRSRIHSAVIRGSSGGGKLTLDFAGDRVTTTHDDARDEVQIAGEISTVGQLVSLRTLSSGLPLLAHLLPRRVWRFREGAEELPPLLNQTLEVHRPASGNIAAHGAFPIFELVASILERPREADGSEVVEVQSDLPNSGKHVDGSLERLRSLLGAKRVRATARFLGRRGEAEIWGDVSLIAYRQDDTPIDSSLFSFGQKRIAALVFYLQLTAGTEAPIIDEVVNGLHYEWIGEVLSMIGDRQAFLTSQNPLLLDHLEFADAGAVRESFILCSTEQRDGHDRMVWRNPTPDEAAEFFRVYAVDTQHVSEILRAKGLW